MLDGRDMRRGLNALYLNAAEGFARRVVAGMGDRIDSVVLYGSAARGEARRDSDIDVVLVSPDPAAVKESVSGIRCDFAYETNFSYLISLVHLGTGEFRRLVQLRSPFVRALLEEGIVLYDNGTFSRIREEATATSR